MYLQSLSEAGVTKRLIRNLSAEDSRLKTQSGFIMQS